MKLFTILILSVALNSPIMADQEINHYAINDNGIQITYADNSEYWIEKTDIRNIAENENGLYILLVDGTGFWIER